jgi:hypothetical protein
MPQRLRILVTGLVGQYPLGGVAWDYLQYVVGLSNIGHDVYYHEDTWSWPYDPIQNSATSDGTYSARVIGEFFHRYAPALASKWHYLHLHAQSFGMTLKDFTEIARTADLFLNVSGACVIPENLSPHCVKVFLDTDPGYNQIVLSEKFDWSENVNRWIRTVRAHDKHFTYAENIWGADCLVPRLDFRWQTTRMPIVLSLWKDIAAIPPPPDSPWSTVMTWSAFKGPLVYKGTEYGSKGYEFDKIVELPRRVSTTLVVAVGGVNPPLQRLRDAGWNVIDAPRATLTAGDYQALIANSRAEFSVAKHVYTALRTGWFSCRSACYLASGRPVVVQDTGFSNVLPVGEGLLAFHDLDSAAEAISSVEHDYLRHGHAAQDIAREYFASEKVLATFVDDAMASA